MVTAIPAIVTVAVACFVVSACDCAMIVAIAVVVTFDGAVYRPVVLIVPAVGPPPNAPSTYQPTVVLDVPVTLALNCCCPPALRLAVAGVTVIATCDGVTVTVADAELALSATDTAFTVTVGGDGGIPGAV